MKNITYYLAQAFTKIFGAITVVVVILMMRDSAVQSQEPEQPRKSPNSLRKTEKKGLEKNWGPKAQDPGRIKMGIRTIELPDEFRTIDGTGNNVVNPEWGSAEQAFIRIAPADYADGASEPSGENRVSARVISNAIHAQVEPVPNRRGASDFLWQWGQFIDHDIDLTPVGEPVEPFDISVPLGDPFFDNGGQGNVTISLDRSFFEEINGVREQFNEITAYIDGSNVYGSDSERAMGLRTNDGTGKMLTSKGGLLPFNTEGFPNAPTAHDPSFFIAGDFRANEQVGLTAMHTLFVREHNYWAGVIGSSNPDLTGDQIYESARVIVAAEIQSITYNEFLPVLLGPRAIPKYRGYDQEVNAGIANEFATAAYRFGHTMLSSTLLRLGRRGDEIEEGHLPLANAFFNPSLLIAEGGIEPILRGLAKQRAQEIDPLLVDDVRNFLFGPPGAGGFDLASLNIQRGRDHGLPSYNATRVAYGLRPARRFSDITPDRDLQSRLEEVYSSPSDMDLWTGGLCEPHARGAMLGETLLMMLKNQFVRLRDGDRFWYQDYLNSSLQNLIKRQTLATIIRRNADISREIQDNVFLVLRSGGRDRFTRGGPPPRGAGGRR